MQAMYPEFNQFIIDMYQRLMPNGFDTTPDKSKVRSFLAVKQWYAETNRVMVWSGESDNTIYGNPAINHCFRAWHDYVHITNDLDFSYQGELAVMEIQKIHARVHYKGKELQTILDLIEYEIKGQLDYYNEYKTFVPNQMEYHQQWMQRRRITHA